MCFKVAHIKTILPVSEGGYKDRAMLLLYRLNPSAPDATMSRCTIISYTTDLVEMGCALSDVPPS
jgi:hypothetical protein